MVTTFQLDFRYSEVLGDSFPYLVHCPSLVINSSH